MWEGGAAIAHVPARAASGSPAPAPLGPSTATWRARPSPRGPRHLAARRLLRLGTRTAHMKQGEHRAWTAADAPGGPDRPRTLTLHTTRRRRKWSSAARSVTWQPRRARGGGGTRRCAGRLGAAARGVPVEGPSEVLAATASSSRTKRGARSSSPTRVVCHPRQASGREALRACPLPLLRAC